MRTARISGLSPALLAKVATLAGVRGMPWRPDLWSARRPDRLSRVTLLAVRPSRIAFKKRSAQSDLPEHRVESRIGTNNVNSAIGLEPSEFGISIAAGFLE